MLDLCGLRGGLCESGTIRDKRSDMREQCGGVILGENIVIERSNSVSGLIEGYLLGNDGRRECEKMMLGESIVIERG